MESKDAFGNPIKIGDKVIFSDCDSAIIYDAYIAHIKNSRCWVCIDHDDCDKWTYDKSICIGEWPVYFRKDVNRVMKVN